jgi:ubiquinone/menaquinone biosynthesis C-methylase UbiE
MIPLDKQERYRELYRSLRPGYEDGVSVYARTVGQYVTPGTSILDAGCGRGGIIELYWQDVKQAVGVDADLASLAEHRCLEQLVKGNLARLPFPASCFDLVLCSWVVEHLDRPDEVFGELARVLRRGGHLVVITPNAWNYVTLAQRLVPGRFQRRLTRKVYGRGEKDTFPVAYKANTRRALDEKLARAGLRNEEFHLVGDPSYVAGNDALFRLAVAWERITDRGPLRNTKVHLVASYAKT